ncbi:MAG: hypothetical protein HQ500_08170 [Flavobacteriales bacterium]|nr:hypothetical protein [Flavobacteriales bacterium]
MMTCKEATEASVRKSQGKVSFRERFDLALHFMACKYCRLFAKQQAWIDQFLSNGSDVKDQLTDEEKSSIKTKINDPQTI